MAGAGCHLFLGSLLFAASMNCIVLPTGMYSGGFLGLAQLLRMGLESLVPGLQSLGDLAGAIYFLLNLPLLAIAWSRFGHYFFGQDHCLRPVLQCAAGGDPHSGGGGV
ncbi:MAG: YitT family protein [Evtepia gabavorous]